MNNRIYKGRKLELLIPASNLEVLKVAVMYGADAVYIGGEAFGLRAKAKNFSLEDMKEELSLLMREDARYMSQLIFLPIIMTLMEPESIFRNLSR